MRLLVLMAWRSLWRHGRRTALILVSVTVGVWSMSVMAALSRGIAQSQVEEAMRRLTGHVQVRAPGYSDDPSVERRLAAPSAALLDVLAAPPVRAWAARLRVPAVVRSERESAATTLVGIDPAREAGLSFIDAPPVEGEGLAGADDGRILLGRELARRLETGVGRRVVVYSAAADGSLAERGFRVAGLFSVQPEAGETAFVFTGLKTAQALLGAGDEVSEVSALGERREASQGLRDRLKAAVPGAEVRDWRQAEPLLVLTESLMDKVLLIWYAAVFLAMSFGLVNTLLMAVFERGREFGLLQALGLRPVLILGQVLLEAAFLLLLGTGAGLGLALATVAAGAEGWDLSAFSDALAFAKMSPVLKPLLTAKDLWLAGGLVVGLGLLASLYPAWFAARRAPAEALSRE